MERLTIIIACCLMLTGCFASDPIPTEPLTPTVTETAAVPSPSESEVTVTEASTTAVTIYYGNENYDGFESTEVQVEEVNMNVLVEELIEVGVLTEDIGILSMKIDGTCLHLAFSPSFGDLIRSQGSTGEYIIMGSVVNTFLDAFNAETVYITAGDETLESGHVVYDYPLEFYE